MLRRATESAGPEHFQLRLWFRGEIPSADYASIVQRKVGSPPRWGSYFDCTPWGGRHVRVTNLPGELVVGRALLDLRTGRITERN